MRWEVFTKNIMTVLVLSTRDRMLNFVRLQRTFERPQDGQNLHQRLRATKEGRLWQKLHS